MSNLRDRSKKEHMALNTFVKKKKKSLKTNQLAFDI